MKSESHYNQLDYQDRQTIAISLEQGLSMRAIGPYSTAAPPPSAAKLPATVEEVATAAVMPNNAMRRRRHSRAAPKLITGNPLFESITELLRLRWSPQQIAAHLAKLHPSESTQRASHETIYNVIYAQPRGELRREFHYSRSHSETSTSSL